ncbi:uncharacterized protein DNG_00835 [Cephalotrichum gorgonifer]|uniref:Transcription factor TFIIIC triple barrel domain-containing protein n=1 Tax=Cephalotrichum gorgonifer TaxID=2041049 RepID=A0AAE8MR07_9PEZI|nr:uncharacterized protein DNG_00835 [Cephalotrichum gorgonifer]
MSATGAERMGMGREDLPYDTTSATATTSASRFEPEDDSEWEYEYSTTETETYYLTVDLSLPEFVYRNPSGIMHFGRGGYYADYINDPDSEHKRSMAHRVVRPGGKTTDDEDEDEDDDESLPEREEDIDEEDPDLDRYAPPRARDGGTEVVDDKLVARDIEILDLHTEHPIISYRGKVFEGSWAEVLGTEMIFAEQAPDDPAALPALRSLPGGVDLLAASSARILTTEKVLTIPEELDRLRATREAYGVQLPVLGKHRIDERKKQVRFLENLMALKMKRGERDQVTVVARPAADKNFADDRDPNFVRRRARPRVLDRHPGLLVSEAGEDGVRNTLSFGRPETRAGGGGRVRWREPEVSGPGGAVPTSGTWSDILPGEEGEGEGEEGEGEEEEEEYGEDGDEDEGEGEGEDYDGAGGSGNEDDDGDVTMSGGAYH